MARPARARSARTPPPRGGRGGDGLPALRAALAPVRDLAAVATLRADLVDGAWLHAGGVPGAGPAILAAALASARGGGCCCITASVADAEALRQDLTTWFPDAADRVLLPAWPEGDAPDADAHAARLAALARLADVERPAVCIAPVAAAIAPVVPPSVLRRNRWALRVGDALDRDALADWLTPRGFERVPLASAPGEWSVRGAVIDVVAPGRPPVRIETDDDHVASLRTYDPISQRSTGQLTEIVWTAVDPEKAYRPGPDEQGSLPDYIAAPGLLVVCDVDRVADRLAWWAARTDDPAALRRASALCGDEPPPPPLARLDTTPLPRPAERPGVDLGWRGTDRWRVGGLDALSALAARVGTVTVCCPTAGDRTRVRAWLDRVEGLADVRCELGVLGHGVEIPELDVAFLPLPQATAPDADEASDAGGLRHKGRQRQRAISDWLEAKPGDYVVHRTHGIAQYLGLARKGDDGHEQDFLVLEFQGGTRLFVPVTAVDLVQKYVGAGTRAPTLSKVGGTGWQRKTAAVRAAVEIFATQLLSVQALRGRGGRAPYPPDDDGVRAFAASFPWPDTPDQERAFDDILADLHGTQPMDRLLTGDVGYGKTEVALRAAYKVVESGKQVAVLVPTTLLALQHEAVFRARLAGTPFTVAALSRMRTGREIRAILDGVATGGIDICIGTHRLLSSDVRFRDLGLVVVDEEQRFGVKHKERLKRWRALVDVLTLTATPIPRTLHMGLLGLRDISTLTTPPRDRQAVQTRVARLGDELMRDAIEREVARGGQTFVVHNRVRGIDRFADHLRGRVPGARVVVAHGQLDEGVLVERMRQFVEREVDVLVATSIVESGLDVPSAGTLIVTDAHRYGLAELHQLRGRVGRSGQKAYAWFCLPPGVVSEAARARVRAMEEFAELGAGFALALRDLEIRGAGNLLGAEQSGHLVTVGYELYCRLLREASARLGQVATPPPPEVALDFHVAAYLPDDYVPDLRQRMVVYRRFGGAETLEEVDAAWDEVADRYGTPPPCVAALAELARLRVLAPRAGVLALTETDTDVVARYVDAKRAKAWRRVWPEKRGLRIIDEATALVRKGSHAGLDLLELLRDSLVVLRP